jgi:GPH family glycoside/pentoside/hexuronide:cation symporter
MEACEPPPLTWRTKIAYASGAAANNIKQRGLSAFLLIFYNQVLGLPPQLVAAAIFIGTIFDAIIDPTIGLVSDSFRSRWGRRHPLIYASAAPVSVGYMLLWCPPAGWSHIQIFGYLIVTLLFVRFFDTLFELSSTALLPELTRNYDERTAIIALRMLFGSVGGLAMTVLAYRVFLRESPDGSGGVLARHGYLSYGVASAVVIMTTILLSAIGTHKRIPYLSVPPARSITLGAILREAGSALNNGSFVALVAAGMLMSVAAGARAALDLYFSLYFWDLSQAQLALLATAALPATIIGVVLAPVLARRFGKRRTAVFALIGGVIGNVGPVLARLAGFMPANGAPGLIWILVADIFATVCLACIVNILVTSMLNDVVEDVQVKTGRRAEGLLLAADNMSKKLVSGLGIFISGMTLTLIAFPRVAQRGTVAPEIVGKLAYAFIPIAICYVVAACMLYFYRIDRAVHEGNLRKLQKVVSLADPNAA